MCSIKYAQTKLRYTQCNSINRMYKQSNWVHEKWWGILSIFITHTCAYGTSFSHSLMFVDNQVLFAQKDKGMMYMKCKLDEYEKWELNILFQVIQSSYLTVEQSKTQFTTPHWLMSTCQVNELDL